MHNLMERKRKKTADEERKDDGEEWSVGRRIMTELINIHFWT